MKGRSAQRWVCPGRSRSIDERASCSVCRRTDGSSGQAQSSPRPPRAPRPRRCRSFTEGIHLNWDLIQGNWTQAAQRAKAHWGKLTDDDIDVVAGRRGRLVGKIQERYGVARGEAENQLSEWQRKASSAWFTQDEDRL